MGKSDVDKISRKEFLELSGLALVGSTLGLQSLVSCESEKIHGKVVGANHAIGHLVKKAISLPIFQSKKTQVLIIGSGISGLVAGYYLQKAGITDYEILELENHIGGNATFGEDAVGRYPWAAHYLPIPSPENKILIDFLAENKIITGFDANGLPIYDEYSLCFHPEERLFVKGYWQEGLIPNLDISEEDKTQIEQFLAKMELFKHARGNDGKWAFTIPLAYSSADNAFTNFDKLTMKEWLAKEGFTSKALLWYINYCVLDDYGTPLSEVSAWAGIHYFASRKGNAANAKGNDVLTWSEGNGFLMKLLAKNQLKNIKTQRLVYQIEEKSDSVLVDVFDWKNEKRETYTANQVIWAIPQMLRPYLMPKQASEFVKRFSYSPWIVANLETKPFDSGRGQALSWDNVIYEGEGLGYILANHQNVNQGQKTWQLTYYKPLVREMPVEERKKAIEKTHENWLSEIIADLKKAHPKIEEAILKMDVKIWGHAMIRPTVGFIHGRERQMAQQSLNEKIHFAHSDLSGVSIFEEAFYHGYETAKKIIKNYANSNVDTLAKI